MRMLAIVGSDRFLFFETYSVKEFSTKYILRICIWRAKVCVSSFLFSEHEVILAYHAIEEWSIVSEFLIRDLQMLYVIPK